MEKLQKKRNGQQWAAIAVLTAAAAALVGAPQTAAAGAKEGLDLCANVIVPSLFPFFVLSALVVDLGLAARLGRLMEGLMLPLFRVSGSCAAAVALGFIGGYPVGAQTAIRLYKQGLCSKVEAERLLAFCNNSGPAFILGVVGAGIFGDGRVGLLLYLTHAAASLLVGLLFRFHGGRETGAPLGGPAPIGTVKLSAAFTGSVHRSLQSILNICGFVVLFSVVLKLMTAYGALNILAKLLRYLGLQPEWAKRLVAGLLELSSGVSSLASGGSFAELASMAAFMLGWAGLSVHCQVLSFLTDSGLSARTYLAGKLCHGVLAAGLTWAAAQLLRLDISVGHFLTQQANTLAELEFHATLAASVGTALAVGLLLAFICRPKLRKKGGKKSDHPVYYKKT